MQRRRFQTPVEHAAAGLLLALLGSVAALRRPIFHDEASLWYGCGFGLNRVLDYLDVHPPLYFLSAAGYFEIFGSNLQGLRIISCLMMGLALFIFLRAWGKIWPHSASRLLAWYCATSPFLIFAASFARYYAFVCLLVAVAVLLFARFQQLPSRARSVQLGLICGAIFLTNYAAAAIVVPILAFAFFRAVVRTRRGALALWFFFPAILAAAPWLPFCASQLSRESPGMAPFSTRFAAQIATAGAYLLYAFAMGDGMPPWNRVGILLWLVPGIFAFRGLYLFWSKGERGRYIVVAVLISLLGGAILGAVLLPGARSLFLPPRVAFLYFGFALFVAAIAPQHRHLSWTALLLLFANFAGIWGLLIRADTTVWAYKVPARAIVRDISRLNLRPDQTSLWYPPASLQNFRFEGEKAGLNFRVNRHEPQTRYHIVLSETRAAQWPPELAVGLREERRPSGEWNLIFRKQYLKESSAARRLKSRFARRQVHPYKLRLEVYALTTSER